MQDIVYHLVNSKIFLFCSITLFLLVTLVIPEIKAEKERQKHRRNDGEKTERPL